MEVTLLSDTSIKIKGKQAGIVVNPQKATKASADAVIFTSFTPESVSGIEGQRLIINGPGEYEIGGIKITGYRVADALSYLIIVDGVDVAVVHAQHVFAMQEIIKEAHCVVVCTDVLVDASAIAKLSPQVVVLYGKENDASAKALGKDTVTHTGKFQTTFEKLPQEMEVVVLQ